MRISFFGLMLIVVALWLATVGFPSIAAIEKLLAALSAVEGSRGHLETHGSAQLITTSVAWAAAISVSASIVGWLPGRLLGRALQRGAMSSGGGRARFGRPIAPRTRAAGEAGGRGLAGPGGKFALLAALMLAPICLPSYIVFFAWWQSWPSGTALYQWVVSHHLLQFGRQLTLYVSLVCWSWPLVAWCVAGSVAATPSQRDELLQVDGAGPLVRLLDRLRCDFRGLMLGAALVFLATLNNTTCFDLAEVFTYANELRAMQALGATPGEILFAGLPVTAFILIGAVAIWKALVGRPTCSGRPPRLSPATAIGTAAIWLISVALPTSLFVGHVALQQNAHRIAKEFFQLYSESVGSTIATAAASACIGACLAIALAMMWQHHHRGLKFLASFFAITWLIAGGIPGTILGMALQAAYNRDGLDELIYQSRLILVIGHMTCFGFVAALLGRWAANAEAPQLAELRRLDGADTFSGMLQSGWPRLLAAAGAAFGAVFVLASGEIAVTAAINPPLRAGAGPLSLTLLNDMHYQRPQTVMVAALGMIAGALIAAFVVSGTWWIMRRKS